MAKFSADQASEFIRQHFREPGLIATALGAGEWSEAFAFEHEGKKLVLRLGAHQNDFLKDQAAGRYNKENLPIPKVLEVGPAPGGYFAISTRVFGEMLDHLDSQAMNRVIPSLFDTLDAVRMVDISGTRGYGPIPTKGDAAFASWVDYLLDVADDQTYRDPDNRIRGWRKLLDTRPKAAAIFDEAYSQLQEHAKEYPSVRFLVHNDFLNRNVLVTDDKISGVIDWANALYGDFLYDLAQFTFWSNGYPAMDGIDWLEEAKSHFAKIGLDVPSLALRLRCCHIHMGLSAMRYLAFTSRWEQLEPTAQKTRQAASASTLKPDN